MSDELFASDGADREKMAAKGNSGTVNLEGWYHFDIGSVEPELGEWRQDGKRNKRHVLFKMVVMHNEPNQSPLGRIYYHRMPLERLDEQGNPQPLSDAQKEQNLLFLETLGVMEWREIDGEQKLVDVVTGSTKVTVDTFMRCKGRHCMAHVKYTPAKGEFKARWEIPYQRVYRLTDETMADKGKSLEMFRHAENYVGNGSAPKQDGLAKVASNF